jgi:hypothetical protein
VHLVALSTYCTTADHSRNWNGGRV